MESLVSPAGTLPPLMQGPFQFSATPAKLEAESEYMMSPQRPQATQYQQPLPAPPPPARMQEAARHEAEARAHLQQVGHPSGNDLTRAEMERQIQELCVSQEALREELQQIRQQVSSNYQDLAEAKREFQVGRGPPVSAHHSQSGHHSGVQSHIGVEAPPYGSGNFGNHLDEYGPSPTHLAPQDSNYGPLPGHD